MAFTRLMSLHLLTVDLLLHSPARDEAVHHHAPLLPYAVRSAGGGQYSHNCNQIKRHTLSRYITV